MVLVLMFLCDQSYASHGRGFLLGATVLNSSDGFSTDRRIAGLAGRSPIDLRARCEVHGGVAPVGSGLSDSDSPDGLGTGFRISTGLVS